VSEEPQQEEPEVKERRSGHDRRRNAVARPRSERASRLLAQLVATLLGALIGFFVANIISAVFTRPFAELVATGETQLTDAQKALSETDPRWSAVNDEWRSLRDKLEGEVLTPDAEVLAPSDEPEGGTAEDSASAALIAGEAVAIPDAGAQGASAESGLEADRARFDELERQREQLLQERRSYESEQLFWSNVLPGYRRNILILDLSSAAVVGILTLLGYLCYPLLIPLFKRFARRWEELSRGPEPRTIQAVIGFFSGMILAVIILLAVFNTFGTQDSILGHASFRLLFGTFVVAILGAAGSLAGMSYFGPPPAEDDPFKEYRGPAPPKIVDTSVIIDGRLHDVATTGFLGGALVVTSSVLHELQSMADSADERRRSKGRRGLELVRKMQDDPRVDVRVFDDTTFRRQAHATDERLIVVAQTMGGMVVTNDYNLNRVAAIRDVRVININALANAVKTRHIPGDFIEIQIIDRGKQKGQGVGYLDDGTMVVIEDGEPYISKSKVVKLTSVTQTVQGRLIFGRVDAAEQEGVTDAG
jgi:uncharacterized protein YacL